MADRIVIALLGVVLLIPPTVIVREILFGPEFVCSGTVTMECHWEK